LQFSDSHAKFPTEEIMGVQNFKFVSTISQNGFLVRSYAFLGRKAYPTIFQHLKV